MTSVTISCIFILTVVFVVVVADGYHFDPRLARHPRFVTRQYVIETQPIEISESDLPSDSHDDIASVATDAISSIPSAIESISPSVRNGFTSVVRKIRESIGEMGQRIKASNKSNENRSSTDEDDGGEDGQVGPEETVFYFEKDSNGTTKGKPMIEIIKPTDSNKITFCRIYGRKDVMDDKMKRNPSVQVKVITQEQMKGILNQCSEYFNSQFDFLNKDDTSRADANTGDDKNTTKKKDSILEGIAIYPGTKWCGAGDVAANYDDLGSEKSTDMCCREHDYCDDNIKAGASKHGLNNTDSYTKSACECDDKFYTCLLNAKSFIGDQVGRTYFNVLQSQCFKKDYPIVKCEDEKGFLFNTVRKSCQSYILDTKKPKVYQFFDAKFYEGKAGPLFNISGVSNIVNPHILAVKDKTINGGILGSIVG